MATLGYIVIYRTYFLPDDVSGRRLRTGSTVADSFPVDTVEEAVDVFANEGLTFAATGTDWAADPDGSRIVDYGTGERVETSGHFLHWTADDARDAIMDAVG